MHFSTSNSAPCSAAVKRSTNFTHAVYIFNHELNRLVKLYCNAATIFARKVINYWSSRRVTMALNRTSFYTSITLCCICVCVCVCLYVYKCAIRGIAATVRMCFSQFSWELNNYYCNIKHRSENEFCKCLINKLNIELACKSLIYNKKIKQTYNYVCQSSVTVAMDWVLSLLFWRHLIILKAVPRFSWTHRREDGVTLVQAVITTQHRSSCVEQNKIWKAV